MIQLDLVRALPHSAANTHTAQPNISLVAKKKKKNDKMKFECGHLLKPATEGCSQFTNHSPAGTQLLIFRQEASSSVIAEPPAV